MISFPSLKTWKLLGVTFFTLPTGFRAVQYLHGCCDACHWHDTLLCYTSQSERLRDAIAALAHRLANSIVPWSDIHVLVSNRFIALDKYPGVRPIGISKSLHQVVGKATCSATRLDLAVPVVLISFVGESDKVLKVLYILLLICSRNTVY